MVIGMGMQVVVKAPITAVWAFTKIIGKAWQWTMLTGISILFLLALISVLLLFVFPTFKRIQTLTDNLNQITRENLIGIRVVRAYNAEHFAQNQFGEANEELTNAHLFTGRMMAVQMPGMSLIMNGMSLGIYWIGAYLINAAVIGTARLSLFGDMVVYNNYAMQLVMSFMSLIMIFNMLPRAAISARRINEVLDTEPVILDGTYVVPDPKVKEAAKLDEATKASLKKSKGTKDELVFLDDEPNRPLLGEVEFKNVNFKYPGASEYVLRDVNFKAKPGDVIAFIGSTGSGKSTIANLIPRLYEVTDGEVLVDGVNVKEYKQDDLHNKIGFISQRAVIFSGTITSNVAYGDNGGKEPTEEEIIKAVEIAQGKDFVEKMPDKYESAISQGGLNISGGQKQRVAIARAVVRKPEIFIFDDSFSALDYQTDRDLRTALKKETNNATCVIVAQRISTIREADTIIVLEQGEVVGNGTHEQLLKDCEVYKEIAYSQLTEEELTHAS
jgi:ATP-binding cassette subfamily B protein